MRNKRISLFVWLCAALLIFGCVPEKEVDINLPDYERALVVECVLEPGKPFRLLLSESVGFSEGLDTPFVEDALVIITHNGFQDTLHETFSFEPVGFKIFNYNSNNVVPEDYGAEYELYIKSADGREVRGTTKVMAPIPVDHLDLDYNDDSLASLTVHWQDRPGEENNYLVYIHRGTLYSADPDYEGGLEIDFTVNDVIGDGEMFTIGTFFSFKKGDTLIASVAEISAGYSEYLDSVDDAVSSNGNPFAMPGQILSTVSGGIGVFTGFKMSRDTIIVP